MAKATGVRCSWGLLVAVTGGLLYPLGCMAPEMQKASNPKVSMAHYRLGADYFGKKLSGPAKAELLEAIELDERNQEAHYLLGVIFFFEGVNAANFVDRTQCLTGEAAEEQRQIANGILRNARKHLLRAVSLAKEKDKIESDALNYLANVALHFREYQETVRFCDEALKNMLYAQQHLALSNRGWAKYLSGDLEGAAADLRQALFYHSKFCLGRYRLAKIYFDEKRVGEALHELETIAGDNDCPIQESFQLLGIVYLRKSMPQKARPQFDRCVSLNPKSCIAAECRHYAELLGGQGQPGGG